MKTNHMKNNNITVFIIIYCLLTLFSINCHAGEGVALIPTSEIDPELLKETPVLWQIPEGIIVRPETHSKAITVLEPDKEMDQYLIPQSPENKNYLPENSIFSLTKNWSVLQIPRNLSRTTILPEGAIYLGYPSVRNPVTKSIDLPEDIEFNQQVQTITDAVSETSLMNDLEILEEFVTRNSYTQGCRDAAVWIQSEFEASGLTVTTQEHDREMGPNVIGEKIGITYPDEIVILCAHYDSISLQPQTLAPGADDNGTGTAALLGAARAMQNFHFERTVRIIAFSGEEQGLRGSLAYSAEANSNGDNIVSVINLDMIGYQDQGTEDLEIIGNTNSEDLVDLFIDCAVEYTSLATAKVINGNITASDHAPFWTYGYQALLGIEDYPVTYPYYHTVEDTSDKVDPVFFTQSAKAGTATVAHIAGPMEQVVYGHTVTWNDDSGDNDGFLDPGETVSVWIQMINNSTVPSGEISLTMLCLGGSQYVTFENNTATIPEIQPGESGSNELDPFILNIDELAPEFSELSCIAAITCDAPHSSGMFFTGLITSYQWNDSIIEFPMDVDPGWSSDSDLWQWGQPLGQGGSEHGNPDPSSGYTGNNVLGTNLAGDYPPDIYATITSPVLDMSDIRQAELHFMRWLNVETPDYDRARVWVVNGEGNHLVWSNSSETTDDAWQPVQIDIAEHTDGRDDVQIAFSLQSDGGWEYSGWNIDDIRIAGLAPDTDPPTPTPTPVPESIGIELSMADIVLESGDTFRLSADWWNSSGVDYMDTPVFVILDIQGAFWFWPEWSHELTHDVWDLKNGATVQDIEILTFIWPDVDGSATDLRFWGALTDAEYSMIIGSYDSITWEYR